MPPILWLTYCWRDNETMDVDYVVRQTEQKGIRVHLDKWVLSAGKRLWEQIGTEITDQEKCNGWAIYATQNSLNSEPCKEELFYALDRALSERGAGFPLIGIFPSPIDRSLIPPAIRTRLYVSTTDPDWAERIRAALSGDRPRVERPEVLPYHIKVWDPLREGGLYKIELRPRAGIWSPFFAGVPIAEKDAVKLHLSRRPAGQYPRGPGMLKVPIPNEFRTDDGDWWIKVALEEATPTMSYFIQCHVLPTRIAFGVDNGQPQYCHVLRQG